MRSPLAKICVGLMGLSAAVACCLVACGEAHLDKNDGAKFVSPKEIGAFDMPPREALLQLAGGEPLKVVVEGTRDGNKTKLALLSHGEEIETEVYSATPTSFNLVEAAGEAYEPSLPLLKFPLTVGDQWSWRGQIMLSSVSIPAAATVTTETEQLGLEGYPVEAVQISVTLEIGDPRARAAKRVLNFWVAPGYGVLKREFGLSSSRTPAPKATEGTPQKGAK